MSVNLISSISTNQPSATSAKKDVKSKTDTVSNAKSESKFDETAAVYEKSDSSKRCTFTNEKKE